MATTFTYGRALGLNVGTDQVHLLDVGRKEYGDAILVRVADRTILIDGAHPGSENREAGHPSLQDQIKMATGLAADGTAHVDLLIITHPHQDHIGCLPNLVKQGLLTTDWALLPDPDIGWGRRAGDPPIDAGVDAAVLGVAAGLREEWPHRDMSDEELSSYLADARTLEGRYVELIAGLETRGTTVVRYGVDDNAELLDEFAETGLRILGPSLELLFLGAHLLADRMKADIDSLTAAMTNVDTTPTPAELFRSAIAGLRSDGLDAGRPGHLINLQSLVVSLEHAGHRLLFTGDMQFVDPGTSLERVRTEVQGLRQLIAANAPYDFVKLSHHGSPNGFDQAVQVELRDSPLYGIVAGEASEQHPHADVLNILNDGNALLDWVRTDRNGPVTIDFETNEVKVYLTRGTENDARPNDQDVAPVRSLVPLVRHPAGDVPAAVVAATPATSKDTVTVTVEIPLGATVTLTVETGRAQSAASARDMPVAAILEHPGGLLGGGRNLGNLLFVTSARALAQNIGESHATEALALVAAAGQDSLLDLPKGHDPRPAVQMVRDTVNARGPYDGIVLLGGYDVVPSSRIDCLSPDMRQRVGQAGDPDDWIVWTDDPYGDTNGDTVPDTPVSRIPDGRDPELVERALTATRKPLPLPPSGIRNSRRLFAEGVYQELGPNNQLLSSAPHSSNAGTPTGLEGSLIYLMLHGDWEDGQHYHGEGVPGGAAALTVGQVAQGRAEVVLAGCCWGGLITSRTASHNDATLAHKAVADSIALQFLHAGAVAFVGCTGAHYSPVKEPFERFGQPMHKAFLLNLQGGDSPARALHRAKVDYATRIQDRQNTTKGRAVEMKTWRQFTCLGLGW